MSVIRRPDDDGDLDFSGSLADIESHVGLSDVAGELDFIEVADDPLADIEPQPNAEADAALEIETLKNALTERGKAERERFAEATATDYYFVVAFENGEQADAFLRAAGYPRDDAQFVDGRILAEKLHIKIPAVERRPRRLKTPDSKLSALVVRK